MEKAHIIYRLFILIILSISTACSSHAPQATPSTNADIEIVAEQFNKWENNQASFFDLLADDVEWTVSGNSPVSGQYQGKSQFIEKTVKPILSKLKAPLQPKLVSLTTDGNFVWLHFTAKSTTISDCEYINEYVWKLKLKDQKIINATAFLDTYELNQLMNSVTNNMDKTIEETKEYIGMWVTEDGYIRHELLPNNRYDEARGNRKSAYQGSYKVTGNHIDYKDDKGFNADEEFKNGILYHAGMIFYKEKD